METVGPLPLADRGSQVQWEMLFQRRKLTPIRSKNHHLPILVSHFACQVDGSLSPWDPWVEFFAGKEETTTQASSRYANWSILFVEGQLTSYLHGMQSKLGRTELLMRTSFHSLGSLEVKMRFPQVTLRCLPLTRPSFVPWLVFQTSNV